MQPDYKMVNDFLNALTGKPDESVTFQYFDDKDKKNIKAAGYRHMKRAQAYASLGKKQDEGCGVFVMVNKGDGKGRSAENVNEVRSLFVDLDGSPWEPAAELLQPHIRVESSPGRWHLYWKVTDCSLEEFKPRQQAIAKKFNGDKSCVDLSRVLRVPGFFHQKAATPYMTRLVEVNDIPEYTISYLAYCLGLELDGKQAARTKAQRNQPALKCTSYEYTDLKTGELIDLTAWAAKNPRFDIVAALDPQYRRGNIQDGKQHMQCPFEEQHTDQGQDLATFIVNASPPEYHSWEIHCCHSHCIGRDRLGYLFSMLEKGWITLDSLQAATPEPMEMKRPAYMNYCAQELAIELNLKPLQHEEFRIFLHLMHIGWVAHDGTLNDDDWAIHRGLGLSPEQWSAFRTTLIRSGWLIEEAGRLFNPITKREYDKSQSALMNKIAGGRKGGLATQGKA